MTAAAVKPADIETARIVITGLYLTARERRILTRYYVCGHSAEHICKRYGLTPHQFKTLRAGVRQAFECFKERLQHD